MANIEKEDRVLLALYGFAPSFLTDLPPELENVKSFTRTNINKPDFTPRKARKSRHFWHFKPTKQNLWGFLWWINVDKLSIYGSLSIDLKFFPHIFSKNDLFLPIILASQTFYPKWPIFLHGYIRQIRDIFQLCWALLCCDWILNMDAFKVQAKERGGCKRLKIIPV